ncbi:MAG: hypothetical protein KGI97_00040 [Alphaproteobacteria bacterium]|nr:hypothetical protein [Alphaproteobacteria bacterium]
MSGNNQQGEPAILLLMVILMLAGLGWLIWHATHDFWLNYFFRWLRFGEIWVINLFAGHRYDACLEWLRYARLPNQPPLPGFDRVTNACFGTHLGSVPSGDLLSYYSLTMPPIAALGALTAVYFRWPMAAALVAVAVYQMFLSPRHKFMIKHTLESFIAVQAKMWPVIMPIVKFNPSKSGRILGDPIPDKLPIFAEALSPEEWLSWCRIPVVNGIPDRDTTRRALIQQLGPRWNGPAALPPYMKALFAVFALKGAQKRDESDELLGRLAPCWSPDKGFRMDNALAAEVEKLIRDPAIGGKAVAVGNRYAWRTTAMLGILRWARAQGGVLAPAQFLWLRAEDRTLWYPLNNLGRRAFHSEGAGAMAHFMAEEVAQKPLPIPRVETAIVTINTYLHDEDKRSVPIPPREDAVKS